MKLEIPLDQFDWGIGDWLVTSDGPDDKRTLIIIDSNDTDSHVALFQLNEGETFSDNTKNIRVYDVLRPINEHPVDDYEDYVMRFQKIHPTKQIKFIKSESPVESLSVEQFHELEKAKEERDRLKGQLYDITQFAKELLELCEEKED